MKTRKIALFICLLLTGCGMYKSDFDCPAGKGIGCAPVGDVLDMIIESEQGSDAFVTDEQRAKKLKQIASQRKQKPMKPGKPTGPRAYELTQDASGVMKLQPIAE